VVNITRQIQTTLALADRLGVFEEGALKPERRKGL